MKNKRLVKGELPGGYQCQIIGTVVNQVLAGAKGQIGGQGILVHPGTPLESNNTMTASRAPPPIRSRDLGFLCCSQDLGGQINFVGREIGILQIIFMVRGIGILKLITMARGSGTR